MLYHSCVHMAAVNKSLLDLCSFKYVFQFVFIYIAAKCVHPDVYKVFTYMFAGICTTNLSLVMNQYSRGSSIFADAIYSRYFQSVLSE